VIVNDLGGAPDGTGSDEVPAAEVVAEIVAAGGIAVADASDVSSVEGARSMIDLAIERFGRIDIVVNNAGIVRWGGLPECDVDNLQATLAVHVLGSFNTTHAAWPHMSAQGYGRVVMTTSSGIFGHPDNLSYATAKAALIGMTRSLAVGGASAGILVNAVAPAAAGRMGRSHPTGAMANAAPATDPRQSPHLVAPMVAFLAHESCEVTGEVFAAGTGRFARMFIAETQGYLYPGLDPTIEDITDNWETIIAERDYFVPTSLMAWAAEFTAHLAR
jgi:NAD(P)-dependent dehydrogenase (short-subunit alcohol dehydrogenase family)